METDGKTDFLNLWEYTKIESEYEMIKDIIFNSLVLDYTGKGLTMKSDSLLIQALTVFEAEKMANILDSKLLESKLNKEDDNG